MKRAALPSSRDQIHLLLACLLGSCCGVLLLLVGLALLPRQPIRSTPDLTLLLLSGVIGASGGLIVFLRRELWEPLKQLLKALPRRISSTRTLVIDDGVAPLQLLAHRINVLLAELKRNATEQREQVETLAHDIRGPLTRLLMRVETLGQQEQHDPELVAGLEADLEALISLDQQLAELSAPMHRPQLRSRSCGCTDRANPDGMAGSATAAAGAAQPDRQRPVARRPPGADPGRGPSGGAADPGG